MEGKTHLPQSRHKVKKPSKETLVEKLRNVSRRGGPKDKGTRNRDVKRKARVSHPGGKVSSFCSEGTVPCHLHPRGTLIPCCPGLCSYGLASIHLFSGFYEDI